MLNLLHSINLGNFGGAELQCLEFVRLANQKGLSLNGLILQSKSFHPSVERKFDNDNFAIFRETNYGPIWIPPKPGFLRSLNRRRIAKKSEYDFLLIWSGLDGNGDRVIRDFDWSKCVNWERGGAWYQNKNSRKQQYIDRVDFSICNSYASKRLLELRWHFNGISEVVHNGLRPSAIPVWPIEPKSISKKKTFVVGIVARLTAIKGIPSAIHALKQVVFRGYDIQLFIAGEGPDFSKLKNLVSELKLHNRVSFLGPVSNVGEIYNKLDVLLVPSIRESFGQVVLEAGIHGVPAIVSQVDGLPETVVDGETGTIVQPTLDEDCYRDICCRAVGHLPEVVYDPISDELIRPRALDPRDLADAIINMIRDPVRYISMSAKAIDNVREKFDFFEKISEVENTLMSWRK